MDSSLGRSPTQNALALITLVPVRELLPMTKDSPLCILLGSSEMRRVKLRGTHLLGPLRTDNCVVCGEEDLTSTWE